MLLIELLSFGVRPTVRRRVVGVSWLVMCGGGFGWWWCLVFRGGGWCLLVFGGSGWCWWLVFVVGGGGGGWCWWW